MANLSLINTTLWVGGLIINNTLNKMALKLTAADLDATTFSNNHQVRLGGLKDTELTGSGLWDNLTDAGLFGLLGSTNQVVTLCPEGLEPKTTYFFQADTFQYEAYGQIGEVTPYSVMAKGSNGVGTIRGQAASGTRIVSATGPFGVTATIAGPTATQFLYASFHVFVAGTILTVLIESAPTSGFAAPVTRATIGPLTTTGGIFITRVAGPITDGFWRFNASAVTGSFTVGGAIAVQ